MTRIQTLLQRGEKLFVPYLTPEFPVKNATVPALIALQQSGANLIELGMPHSDPLADGRTIQEASHLALRNGATLKRVLEVVREARTAGVTAPLILMGYVNPLLRYGMEKFLDDAASSGVDGFILPDVPPEESGDIKALCDARNLSLIFLLSPVTSPARMKQIDALSTDFSYCVSTNAVTGTDKLSSGATVDGLSPETRAFLTQVRAQCQKKFIVGFGIRSAEQVRAVFEAADGAVVGSALLAAISAAATPAETAETAAAFWTSLLP